MRAQTSQTTCRTGERSPAKLVLRELYLPSLARKLTKLTLVQDVTPDGEVCAHEGTFARPVTRANQPRVSFWGLFQSNSSAESAGLRSRHSLKKSSAVSDSVGNVHFDFESFNLDFFCVAKLIHLLFSQSLAVSQTLSQGYRFAMANLPLTCLHPVPCIAATCAFAPMFFHPDEKVHFLQHFLPGNRSIAGIRSPGLLGKGGNRLTDMILCFHCTCMYMAYVREPRSG